MLALNLPAKHVLPEALSFAQNAIRSPEPRQRAAACTVVVDVAEGCAEAVKKQLLPILQVLTPIAHSQSIIGKEMSRVEICWGSVTPCFAQ